MKFDPKVHHRASTRLQGYDYALAGAYFITIVTYQRKLIFGEIVKGHMNLNRHGEIVQEEWFLSAEIRKEVRLFADEFVVMPNHIHGIVWIVENHIANDVSDENVEATNIVGADGRPPLHMPSRKPRSLGSFVAGFKSSVTKRIRDELHETASGNEIITTALFVMNENWMQFANTSKPTQRIGLTMMNILCWENNNVG